MSPGFRAAAFTFPSKRHAAFSLVPVAWSEPFSESTKYSVAKSGEAIHTIKADSKHIILVDDIYVGLAEKV
jgi:hypothetical protein